MNPQLALLLIAALSVQIATFGSRMAVPLVAIQLGANPTTVGILLSFFSVVPFLLSLPAGRLVDRIGAKVPLTGGCACQAAGLLIGVAWPGTVPLAVTTALLGAGHMLVMLPLNNMAGAIGGASGRARMFNHLTLVYSVGVMVGPLVAGFALEFAGHRATFFLLALPQIVTLLWIGSGAVRVPDTRHPAAQASGSALQLLRMRDVRRVLLISALSPLCWELYYIFMPIHGSRIGLSPAAIGSILGGFAAAIIVVRLLMPALHIRLGSWPLLAISLIGSAVAVAAMPFATTGTTLAAVSLVFGALVGVTFPLQLMLLYDAAPEGRKGEASGLRQTLIYAISLAAPAAFAAMSGVFGFAPLMLLTAAALGGGGGFAWRIGAERTASRR